MDRKELEIILLFEGIQPPPPDKDKTTCPKCSHLRKKTHRPCLKIKQQNTNTIRVYCYNCGWSDKIVQGAVKNQTKAP